MNTRPIFVGTAGPLFSTREFFNLIDVTQVLYVFSELFTNVLMTVRLPIYPNTYASNYVFSIRIAMHPSVVNVNHEIQPI